MDSAECFYIFMHMQVKGKRPLIRESGLEDNGRVGRRKEKGGSDIIKY